MSVWESLKWMWGLFLPLSDKTLMELGQEQVLLCPVLCWDMGFDFLEGKWVKWMETFGPWWLMCALRVHHLPCLNAHHFCQNKWVFSWLIRSPQGTALSVHTLSSLRSLTTLFLLQYVGNAKQIVQTVLCLLDTFLCIPFSNGVIQYPEMTNDVFKFIFPCCPINVINSNIEMQQDGKAGGVFWQCWRKPLSQGLPGVFLSAVCGVGSLSLGQGGSQLSAGHSWAGLAAGVTQTQLQGWHSSQSILTPPWIGPSSRAGAGQRTEPRALFESSPFTLQTNYCWNHSWQAPEELLCLSLGGRNGDCVHLTIRGSSHPHKCLTIVLHWTHN